MFIKIKVNGVEQKPVPLPNKMHLEVQTKTRMNIIPSKKLYNRKRDRKVEW